MKYYLVVQKNTINLTRRVSFKDQLLRVGRFLYPWNQAGGGGRRKDIRNESSELAKSRHSSNNLAQVKDSDPWPMQTKKNV
jgi:hypothetical protein